MKLIDYILIAIVLLIIVLLVHGFYKRLILLRMFYGSLLHINHFGLIIAISGNIRSGKTTLTAGLTHLYTFKIINHLQERMTEIEIILKEINFVKYKNEIDLVEINIDNFKDRINIILNNFLQTDDDNQNVLTHGLIHPYFDFLNYLNKINLLKEYALCYLHLKRTSYVYSNVRMFNHITLSYSYEFNNEWIKLKNNNDFPFIENSIMVEDDKLIYDSNIGYMKKLYEDSGSDLFFRLAGHLFREKSFYICTVQDVNRWIKLEREIAQTHIFVFKSNIVGNYPKINWLLQFYESSLNFIYKKMQRLYKNDRFFNENNWFKRRFYKIHQLRKKLFSKSFVRFDVGIYSDIEKVGKEIKDEDKTSYYFSFVLPVPYVYGSLNTHEFHCLYDYLYNRSKLKYSDLKETELKEDEILEILKKYDAKSSTNTVNNFDNNLKDVF